MTQKNEFRPTKNIFRSSKNIQLVTLDNLKVVEEHEYGGVYHREDGPAVIWNDGTKEYYIHGERHRDDGPAIEDEPDEGNVWYKNGLIHRDDGPAVMWPDGTLEWWFEGQYCDFDEYLNLLYEFDSKKATVVKLKYRVIEE